MRTVLIRLTVLLLLAPSAGFALDLGDLENQLKKLNAPGRAEKILPGGEGVLAQLTTALSWETLNMSFTADMHSSLETLDRRAEISSKVYKRGLNNIRLSISGDVVIPQAKSPLALKDFYVLRRPLDKEAFIVLPAKETYMQCDPERSRELLGEFKERLDTPGVTVEQKEHLGTEILDSRLCDKVHGVLTLENGIKSDVTAWLAKDLEGFPVKIVSRSTTPRAVTAVNTTLFTNIRRESPDVSLFVIPESYTECSNMLELASGGRLGKRLNRNKARRLKRR